MGDLLGQMRGMLRDLENVATKAEAEVASLKQMIGGFKTWLAGFERAAASFVPAAEISISTADEEALNEMEDAPDVDHA